MKTTEERDVLREHARRRNKCPKCGGSCEQITGLDDEGHFPGVIYKRCTACGWEIAMRSQHP